jgi:glyoxylase-like metal-dependent hydrolase (beta-lactamase superfamily II)
VTTQPFQRWKLGDTTVTKVLELETVSGATWILPEATPARLAAIPWLVPHFADADGRAVMSVHALVIESPGRRILVDTCVGNDKVRPIPGWDRRQGSFLADLAAAGFPAESIDTVLCTHLHVDHVGWNTRLEGERWVPTFPNARYLFHARELAYWNEHDDRAFGDVMGDSVRPVLEAGLVDLVEADHAVAPGVRLEPTPGHTPGHVSVRLRSAGEEAVITGDLMHHPVQCAFPDWASRADVDPAQAVVTRRSFLEGAARTSALVFGTHFAGPTAGRVVREDAAFRFDVRGA